MRTLKIIRPKAMEACAMKLTVEIDGHSVGKLANGKELSTEMDEQSHEIYLHGGLFAGKDFNYKLTIPSGSYSYNLQIDMLSVNDGYKPVLRPCGDTPIKASTRLNTLMAAELTELFFNEKLRGVLKDLPNARLQIVLGAEEWKLEVCAGSSARRTVSTNGYSKYSGSVLGSAVDRVARQAFDTPEGQEEFFNKLHEMYLQYLPDYTRTAPNEYALTAVNKYTFTTFPQ